MEIEPPSDSNDPSQLGSALRQLVDAHLHAATVDVDTMQELTLAVQVTWQHFAFILWAFQAIVWLLMGAIRVTIVQLLRR